MILIALIASLIISTGSFAWGYWRAGYEDTARWIVAFGILWLVCHWRKSRWVSSPAIFLALLLAAFGVWFKFNYGWMFSGAVFALVAWDLADFRQKIRFMPAREDIAGRTRRRILRISILILAGFALVSLFMLSRGQFTSDWGLFLLAVILFGSLQVFAWRRGSR
jgi:hypothetical protein